MLARSSQNRPSASINMFPQSRQCFCRPRASSSHVRGRPNMNKPTDAGWLRVCKKRFREFAEDILDSMIFLDVANGGPVPQQSFMSSSAPGSDWTWLVADVRPSYEINKLLFLWWRGNTNCSLCLNRMTNRREPVLSAIRGRGRTRSVQFSGG